MHFKKWPNNDIVDRNGLAEVSFLLRQFQGGFGFWGWKSGLNLNQIPFIFGSNISRSPSMSTTANLCATIIEAEDED